MKKEYVVEVILIFIISVLFCISLFSVYSLEKIKIDNVEKDVTEIKSEVYKLRLDFVTLKEQLVNTK